MSLLSEYEAIYARIAVDHVTHWRDTGGNPFQDAGAVKRSQDVTLDLVTRYVPSGRLLDVGCGMGDLLAHLTGYQAMGVDIAEPYLDVARERGLDVTRAQAEKLPFAASIFDGVVATDVLEHVIDLHAATQEILRVMRKKAHVIVRVPNWAPVEWDDRYGYVHLRTLDEGTLRCLFGYIFGCEVRETLKEGDALHLVAQKC